MKFQNIFSSYLFLIVSFTRLLPVYTMMTTRTAIRIRPRHCFVRPKFSSYYGGERLNSGCSFSSTQRINIQQQQIPHLYPPKNHHCMERQVHRRTMVSLHGSTTTLSTLSFRRKRQQQQQQHQHEQLSDTSFCSTRPSDDVVNKSNSGEVDQNVKRNGEALIISGRTSIAARSTDRVHVLYGDGLPPPDPTSLQYDAVNLNGRDQLDQLLDWMYSTTTSSATTADKGQPKNILCLTGAGMSTESGIPDYRGHQGSYYKGHKPMIHDQFMKSSHHRQRYWGRGMVGWRFFDQKSPNSGHIAISELEKMGILGVTIDDREEFYDDDNLEMDRRVKHNIHGISETGQRQLSLITQNVDTLHRRAGTQHLVELHGRTDIIRCMNCGHTMDRVMFHEELEDLNTEWFQKALDLTSGNGVVENIKNTMRADADADVPLDYDGLNIPACHNCHHGFYKPDVVFFGDTVPSGRVKMCQAAVDPAVCQGILVVGTSLAVHSAYRHIRSASQQQIPICIVNVGETRAEVEQLPGILKIEAAAGPLLTAVTDHFREKLM